MAQYFGKLVAKSESEICSQLQQLMSLLIHWNIDALVKLRAMIARGSEGLPMQPADCSQGGLREKPIRHCCLSQAQCHLLIRFQCYLL